MIGCTVNMAKKCEVEPSQPSTLNQTAVYPETSEPFTPNPGEAPGFRVWYSRFRVSGV